MMIKAARTHAATRFFIMTAVPRSYLSMQQATTRSKNTIELAGNQ